MASAIEPTIRAVVLAAGHGSRLGADKALVDLQGHSAIARLAMAYRLAGLVEIDVVRALGADPIPAELALSVITTGPGEMIDSLCRGLSVIGPGCEAILLSPVDYPLVSAATISALAEEQKRLDPDLLLPLHGGRPGHPILLSRRLFDEVMAPEVVSLRAVIRRDPSRVRTLAVEDPWIHRDIDEPEDLAAARAYLRGLEPGGDDEVGSD